MWNKTKQITRSSKNTVRVLEESKVDACEQVSGRYNILSFTFFITEIARLIKLF